MSWEGYYNQIRAVYPTLPPGVFEPGPAGFAYFMGITEDGKARFVVYMENDANLETMWHEAGHALHSQAALVRDRREGHGTAGDDIIREVGAIIAPSLDILNDPMRHEYVAEAFRKANTGRTDIRYYPEPQWQVAPYPFTKLKEYFQHITESPNEEKTMAVWHGPVPNMMPGRSGATPSLIVLHHMDGYMAGTDTTFKDPASGHSAHYGVGRAAEVWQWVDEKDTAYHAGIWQKNLVSIGIEHEDARADLFTDEQYSASATLVRDICARWGIPMNRTHIIGHNEVLVGTACPGSLDIDRIVQEATGNMVSKEEFESYKQNVRETIDAMKEELAKQAHHTHNEGRTGEPENV